MRAVNQNLEQARSITKDAVGSSDVPVMFDGTWQKRGHKSHNGVGAAVSLDPGLCLDFQALSNYCLACSIHKDMGDQEQVWQAFHRPVCAKNTTCSSHAMEPEAAVRIWQRTLSYETPLRFTQFLSDGDSKAFTAVCAAEVYGDTAIEKQECTNHVAKRLGTALRKLPTPLPRGEKLKDSTINQLQTYYQIAVVSNRVSAACTPPYGPPIFPRVLVTVPAATSFALRGWSRGASITGLKHWGRLHRSTPHF